jgi:hypothetical protein
MKEAAADCGGLGLIVPYIKRRPDFSNDVAAN